MANRWSCRGKATFTPYDSTGALVGGPELVGDMQFTLKPKTETKMARSYTSALGSVTDKWTDMVECGCEIEIREVTRANMTRFLFGTDNTINSGSASAEVMNTGLVAGQIVNLDKIDVSNVTGVDSAGSPTTLTGTHFSVYDAKAGQVLIKSVAGLTQPLKFSYDYAAQYATTFLSADPKRYHITLALTNIANRAARGRAIFHEVFIEPPADWVFYGDDMAVWKIEGTLLKNDTAEADATLGPFGVLNLLA